MRRLGELAVCALVAGACSFSAGETTTPAPTGAPSTSTTVVTTTTVVAPPATTAPTTTTTTLARLPDALPIVEAEWEWTRLVEAEQPFEVRYDGTYLAYTNTSEGPLRVERAGQIVLEHWPIDDSEWIIQDVEMGDHWLGVVENTGYETSRLVVYDLRTGEVAFEQLSEEAGGRLSIPSISISGRYMATAPQTEAPACVDVIDLALGHRYEQVCADADGIYDVELDAGALAFVTRVSDCRMAWTGTLYGSDHNVMSRFNRECWSGSPASSGEFSIWFESPPQQIGIDTMIGMNIEGDEVGLGKGANGTLEICWNRAYWLSGNNDVRTWDGDGPVETIYEAGDDRAYELGCVGPWVTFHTTDAIYTTNALTQSGADACDVTTSANATQEAELAESLRVWVRERFDDLPEDLEVSVSSVVGKDGWWTGSGGFSSHLEGAVFTWSPDGDISIAWAGNADSEYEIRAYMLASLPAAPGAMLGCVDVSGYYTQ